MNAITERTRQVTPATPSRVEAQTPHTPPSALPVAWPEATPAAIPLGQLLRQAARAVQVGLPDAVWVVAAVAALKPARGGSTIELVEPDVPRGEAGLLRCYLPDGVVETLRRNTGQAVAISDLAGMTIVVRVSVELHPRWGLSGKILTLGPGIEESLAKRALAATVERLRREGLLDRQRSLRVPRDITRVAVVHPAAAAGWADIAGELSRWAALGVLMVRSVPVPFEGPGAAAGIAAAVGRAAAAVEGLAPDVVLIVRGGGSALGLCALDNEALARAIATAPVPVITGLGHASDAETLADRVAWRKADTPSKSLSLLREIIVAPARRARADHAAVVAAVSAGLDRAAPRLAVLERVATAEALRRAIAASESLDRIWGAVREAAEAARGRMARLDDRLDRDVADIATASPLLMGRTASELAALMEAIRARARSAGEGADDGARHLAVVAERAAAMFETATVSLATLGRTASAAAAAQVDRDAAELDVLDQVVRERSRGHVTGADDGSRAIAVVEAAIVDTHRAQDAAIARLHEAIEVAVARRVDAAAAALDRALATLDGADPATVLRLGYVLVMDGQGRAITSVAAARVAATPLVLTFTDGTVAVQPTRPQFAIGDKP